MTLGHKLFDLRNLSTNEFTDHIQQSQVTCSLTVPRTLRLNQVAPSQTTGTVQLDYSLTKAKQWSSF